MDSLAHGALGSVHWSHAARLFERIMNDKPHPLDGLPFLSGDQPSSGQYSPARMEAAAERACDGSLPLSEREVDSEELTRHGTPRGASRPGKFRRGMQHWRDLPMGKL